MQYSQFQERFLNQVFVPYMQGEKGQARVELANLYRAGKANPRGTMLQVTSSLESTKDAYLFAANELKKTKQNQALMQLFKNYTDFSKELSGSKHPILESAVQEINAAIKEIYPSVQTRKASKFILLKSQLPFLAKFKFLSKII